MPLRFPWRGGRILDISSTPQLNIKNPEARQLAMELSRMTGESITQAVTTALRERLERMRKLQCREGVAEKLMAIADELAHLPVLDARKPDEILYDEVGLPR